MDWKLEQTQGDSETKVWHIPMHGSTESRTQLSHNSNNRDRALDGDYDLGNTGGHWHFVVLGDLIRMMKCAKTQV